MPEAEPLIDDPSSLRTEAELIARQLEDPDLSAKAAQILHPGAAGRRRAGSGEQFWQYRRYAQTDGADQVDWRRSARGDDLFVRESELETPRTVLFWVDPDPGFHWSSAPSRPTKAFRASVLSLALGISLARHGERIGGLSGAQRPRLGHTAPDHLARLLTDTSPQTPRPPSGTAVAVIASDFYAPLSAWKTRLTPLLGKCPQGLFLAVSDPVEETFPFAGRTRFSRPGQTENRIVGRAETLQAAYLERLAQNRSDLTSFATQIGWGVICHTTDQPALPAAAAMQRQMSQFGVRP